MREAANCAVSRLWYSSNGELGDHRSLDADRDGGTLAGDVDALRRELAKARAELAEARQELAAADGVIE